MSYHAGPSLGWAVVLFLVAGLGFIAFAVRFVVPSMVWSGLVLIGVAVVFAALRFLSSAFPDAP